MFIELVITLSTRACLIDHGNVYVTAEIRIQLRLECENVADLLFNYSHLLVTEHSWDFGTYAIGQSEIQKLKCDSSSLSIICTIDFSKHGTLGHLGHTGLVRKKFARCN